MILTELQGRSFVIIRHGETIANRDGIIAGRMNVPLTKKGNEQASALAHHPWPEHMSLFTSPQERAIATCRQAFPGHTFETVKDLRERDWGIFEGQPLTNLPERTAMPDNGEGWEDFLHRAGQALHTCCHHAKTGLPILVCHSGIIRAARLLTGQPTTGARPPNATPILFRWVAQHHRHHEELFHGAAPKI